MGGLASAVVGSVLSPIAAAGLHLNRSALGGLWVSTGWLTLWSVLSWGVILCLCHLTASWVSMVGGIQVAH